MSSTSGSRTSEYVLIVSNISSRTRRSDIEYELERAGRIRSISKIHGDEMLVEMKHRSDADWACRKMDRLDLDGRSIRLHFATEQDMDSFGWEFCE